MTTAVSSHVERSLPPHSYEDFQQRIPRSEVEEIRAVVQAAAQQLVPGVTMHIAGSFR